ncbi:MAG TPA: tetratricopeptide repeat protein [Gallionella sp.]|nr:tetratricopeptide repeat protein [Gallionella sp.]
MNRLLLSSILMSVSLAAIGAEVVPDAGLRAEMEGRWNDAIKVYQEALQRDAGQTHLWQRIADIQARQGNPAAAADALEQATRHAPNDAKLWFRLSQAQGSAKRDAAALEAVKHAVALDPNNVEYLRAQAVLASSTKDFALSASSYAKVLELAPGDMATTLAAGRANVWKGDRDSARKYYQVYVKAQPQDKVALMEYIELEAERGDYPAALAAGELYRQRYGESLEYWLRMADLYALSGNDQASAEALQNATRFSANDPALFYRLAQAYPSLKDAKHAMAAINRAVELDSRNLEYLQSRADLAAWSSDYPTALDSYRRILAIDPNNPGAILGIARVNAWSGQTDESAKYYKAYLAKHPQVQVAWIEYIEVETERGDYARAIELLEEYRQRFGDIDPYKKQKARVLAWADRPTPALGIVDAMEPAAHKDYHLSYTRTVALNSAHRPREALASLEETKRLRAQMKETEGEVPEVKETHDLERVIKTPLRSFVRFSANYGTASDRTATRPVGIDGQYQISPETRLFGGADRLWLHAATGSGFETPDGRENTAYNRAWLGLGHRFTPKLAVDARVGGGSTDGKQRLIYEVGADFQPVDELATRLSRRQDLYAVSPRAAALGIERRENILNATWTPDLRWTIDGMLAYDTFSDSNIRSELDLAPRRAFLRTQRLNLDLGVSGQWFSFNHDPGNGYYAPRMYQRYAVNVYTYWKFSDDDGLSVTFSLGPWKDNTLTGYRPGADIVAEGTIGLYRDWMFKVQAGLSNYGGGTTGAYRSRGFGLSVTRRF